MITVNNIRADQFIFGGMLAISLVILQAFITSGSFDLTSTIAVIAFAFAIPQLGIATLISSIHKPEKVGEDLDMSCSLASLLILALIVDFAGIIAAFWHFSWIAGIVVLISGSIGVVILVLDAYLAKTSDT